MTDDDIRDMLRTKAREATTSPDAWDKIAVRLGEQEVTARQLPRRLAVVAVAAAAVAGIVVVANRPDTDPPVTQTTTTSESAPTLTAADEAAIRGVVDAWLSTRVPDVQRGNADITPQRDGTASVRFSGGDLHAELSVTRLSGVQGWGVLSATSDLVLIDNPTYDGHEVVAEAIPAVTGDLVTTYFVTGTQHVANPGIETISGGRRPVTHEAESLGHPIEGADSVTVQVVLTTDDGITGISEVPATVLRDPATVTGSYVSLTTDAVGLETLQQQADNKRRPDLLDPQNVAGDALYELLPEGETSTSYALGDFRKIDGYRGEVPYTLSDGSSGVVELHRTQPDDTKIWYATGVTSEGLEVLKFRHEPNALVVDVRVTADGTLTMTGGDAPIEVKAGQKVSISRTEGPSVETGPPVELRLKVGRTTLAVLAELPR